MNRRTIVFLTILSAIVLPAVLNAQTWTAPTLAPTGGNTATPLNIGATSQIKSGGLEVGSFINDGGSWFKGNVGIGTVSPGAKLEVVGQVKITGGTPGAGKVLTSDAAGLATWNTPAASGVTSITSGTGLTGGTITTTGTIGADTTYLQRRVSGSCGASQAVQVVNADGTVTCVSTSGGGGTLTGSGTANTVSKWTGATSQGNSIITDDGTTVTHTGATRLVGYGVDNWFPYTNGQNYIRGPLQFNGVLYDEGNNGYYVDPNAVSIFNDLRASIFYDFDNTAYYTNPASTSYINGLWTAGAARVDGGITSWGNNSHNYYHGNYSQEIILAAQNSGGTGDAALYTWVSEPGATWTGAGIARNMRNSSGAFPRVNTGLSSQMIRFDEGTGINFTVETSGGSRTNPFSVSAGQAAVSGNLCLNGDCRAAWPSAGSAGTLDSVIAAGPSTNNVPTFQGGINLGNQDASGSDTSGIKAWNTLAFYSTCCGFTTATNYGIQFNPRDGTAIFKGTVTAPNIPGGSGFLAIETGTFDCGEGSSSYTCFQSASFNSSFVSPPQVQLSIEDLTIAGGCANFYSTFPVGSPFHLYLTPSVNSSNFSVSIPGRNLNQGCGGWYPKRVNWTAIGMKNSGNAFEKH